MIKHIKYLVYLLKHKWFVLIAGLKIGVPLWRLLVHDLSKFRPSEWFPYTEFFYSRSKRKSYTYNSDGQKRIITPSKDDKLGQDSSTSRKNTKRIKFDRAWMHHQNRNDHHWQYWLLVEDTNIWSIVSDSDEGPFFLSQNLQRFNFPINIEWKDNDSYKELMRLKETLNIRPIPLPMPRPVILEMVADWMGTGRAITGEWEVKDWYQANKDKMTLHQETRKQVEEILENL